MEPIVFWRMMETANADAEGDCFEQAEALKRAMEDLPLEEILSFQQIYADYFRRAYRWDLWGAAYLINGGCSDDGFMDFRAWLIAQGERDYMLALSDPDSLAEIVEEAGEAWCEPIQYVAGQVYEAKTGQELPASEQDYGEPDGEPWEEDDLPDLFPRLAALFEDED